MNNPVVYIHVNTIYKLYTHVQHVLQKQHKEESRKREIDTQKEEKRKAAERLREMKETERRKLLEYKGLISSSKLWEGGREGEEKERETE